MVLFFSATGNTKLMAEALAESLNDECVDLLPRIKNGDHSVIRSEKPFVICSPVYVSELPSFISDFIKKAVFAGSRDVYGVLTDGGFSGITGGQLRSIFRRKGMRFKGYAEFKLASNHITNKSHKRKDDEEIKGLIRTALSGAGEAAGVIRSGKSFKNRHIFLLEYLITVPVAPVLCYFNQKTKGFWVRENCVSCGKCARLCPMNVIEMLNGRPAWKADRCAHCMSCIQNCPADAIEYKNITENRKRYSVGRLRIDKD